MVGQALGLTSRQPHPEAKGAAIVGADYAAEGVETGAIMSDTTIIIYLLCLIIGLLVGFGAFK